MVQLILIGGIILALGGAFWSYSDGQQKVGAAKVEAEYERQQKEAEQANTLRALEGERYANELLDKAQARNRAQAVQLAAVQKQRETANVERAKVDPVYRAWSDERVPDFVVDQLRTATQLAAADATGNRLPAGADLPSGTPVPTVSGAPDQSWSAKFRARIGRTDQGGVGRSGKNGK